MTNDSSGFKALFEYSCVAIVAVLIALALSHCENTNLENEIESLNREIEQLDEDLSNEYDRGYDSGFDAGFSRAVDNFCIFFDEDHTSPEIGKCYNCNAFYSYSDSWGYGLCSECYEEILVPCCICEESTFPCYNNEANTICPHCIGVLFDETDIDTLIIDFFGNY